MRPRSRSTRTLPPPSQRLLHQRRRVAVTNYHSIDGSIYGTATLITGDVYEVERVLYYDPGIDIAVIKVSQTALKGSDTSAFSFLEMVGTDDARAGDTVYALGNPLGMGLSVSSGIISATDRKIDNYTLPCVMNTADISHGSSGGACSTPTATCSPSPPAPLHTATTCI